MFLIVSIKPPLVGSNSPSSVLNNRTKYNWPSCYLCDELYASSHPCRVCPPYSEGKAEGMRRRGCGEGSSRLHRFLNLFARVQKEERETSPSEFVRLKIYPMRVVYQAALVPPYRSPHHRRFLFSIVLRRYPPFYHVSLFLFLLRLPRFPLFIFLLYFFLLLFSFFFFSFLVFFFLFTDSSRLVNNFSIARVDSQREIFYSPCCYNSLRFVKNSETTALPFRNFWNSREKFSSGGRQGTRVAKKRAANDGKKKVEWE